MSNNRVRFAFTLTEVLVVIGVVGLLLALLLPALSVIRQQSKATACLAHQRELGKMLSLRAAAHDGFCQPVGIVNVGRKSDEVDIPERLSDARKVRYTYFKLSPLFPSGPLSRFLAAVDADLRSFGGDDSSTDELFLCAAETMPANVQMIQYEYADGSREEFINSVATHFAFNETVFGIGQNLSDPRRLRGNFGRVREASRVVLLGDAEELGGTSPIFTWRAGVSDGPVPMAALVTRGPDAGPSAAVSKRHRGRANLLFADGHAAGFEATAGGLADPLLAAQ